MHRLNILILEDSTIDAKIIVRHLEQAGLKFHWKRIFTAEDLSKVLNGQIWDAIISDYEMGKFDGIEALKIVRSHSPEIPFIMVSGVIGEETAVESMKLGASDYVMKDNLTRLVPALERELKEFRKRKKLHDELIAAEQKLSIFARSTRDAIFIMDENRCVSFWNPAAEKMFGYPAHEIENKDIFNFIVPDFNRSEYSKRFDNFQKSGFDQALNRTVEILAKKKNGTEFFVEVTLSGLNINGKNHLAGITRDISKRKRAEQELKHLVMQKETLLKEVFHRVKNNFQLIYSLISLQINRLDNQAAIEILNESKNRIRSMSIIHEKLYQAKNLQNIDFSDYLKTLVYQLYQSYCPDFERIFLKLEINKVVLSIDQAIPCGLIVNELVTNALKYGFPSLLNVKGDVRVSLREQSDNQVELIVSDNGVGIPKNIDLKNSGSLGLELVALLTEDQLDGSVYLDKKNGTKIVIRFNKSKQ